MLEFHSDFTIECLGEIEEEVYDIEVEDNHNFFANDILVHNSCYISLAKAVGHQFRDNPGVDDHEKIEWLCGFADGPMKKVVKIANKKACSVLNAYDPSRFDADREAVSRRGVFVMKKMYALALSDMEGVRYKEPKLKIVGLQAKKSSTPAFFRDKMEKFFKTYLNGDIEASIDYISSIERDYKNAQIDEIASNASVSDVNSKVDENSVRGYGEGTHFNAKAAINFNRMIQKDERAKEYLEPIVNGDKIKMLPLKLPNPVHDKIIAWKDEWPEYFDRIDLRNYVDWELHFQKAFKKPLDRIYTVCKINPNVSKELDLW